jgi:hypothetical protein
LDSISIETMHGGTGRRRLSLLEEGKFAQSPARQAPSSLAWRLHCWYSQAELLAKEVAHESEAILRHQLDYVLHVDLGRACSRWR